MSKRANNFFETLIATFAMQLNEAPTSTTTTQPVVRRVVKATKPNDNTAPNTNTANTLQKSPVKSEILRSFLFKHRVYKVHTSFSEKIINVISGDLNLVADMKNTNAQPFFLTASMESTHAKIQPYTPTYAWIMEVLKQYPGYQIQFGDIMGNVAYKLNEPPDVKIGHFVTALQKAVDSLATNNSFSHVIEIAKDTMPIDKVGSLLFLMNGINDAFDYQQISKTLFGKSASNNSVLSSIDDAIVILDKITDANKKDDDNTARPFVIISKLIAYIMSLDTKEYSNFLYIIEDSLITAEDKKTHITALSKLRNMVKDVDSTTALLKKISDIIDAKKNNNTISLVLNICNLRTVKKKITSFKL